MDGAMITSALCDCAAEPADARPADSVCVGARARAGPLHQPLFRQAERCGSDRAWAVAAAGRIFTVINM